MPTNSPTTNKTEFQRYLNVHPRAVPALASFARTYADNPHGRGTFGFWLRVKHRPVFDRAYASWWLASPRLFGQVYEDAEQDFARQNSPHEHNYSHAR